MFDDIRRVVLESLIFEYLLILFHVSIVILFMLIMLRIFRLFYQRKFFYRQQALALL